MRLDNLQVSSQAKENALLFAMHADVMAKVMQKAGYATFTAKDYMKNIGIDVNAIVQGQWKSGLAQNNGTIAEEKNTRR